MQFEFIIYFILKSHYYIETKGKTINILISLLVIFELKFPQSITLFHRITIGILHKYTSKNSL